GSRARGGAAGALDPVDRAVERGRIDVAGGVLAEARQARHMQAGRVVVARGGQGRGVDVALAEVAVDVTAEQLGQLRVAHDVAAGDRDPAVGVRVRDDREGV